jgi:hypothetical protein
MPLLELLLAAGNAVDCLGAESLFSRFRSVDRRRKKLVTACEIVVGKKEEEGMGVAVPDDVGVCSWKWAADILEVCKVALL